MCFAKSNETEDAFESPKVALVEIYLDALMSPNPNANFSNMMNHKSKEAEHSYRSLKVVV